MGRLLEALRAETRPAATPATVATQRPKSSRVARVAAHLDDVELRARCRDACKGLSLWPQELLAAMSDEDREAQRDGSEGIETLRAFAESLASRLRTGKLPDHLHEAYARLRLQLAEHPTSSFASEVLTPDDDPVLMAVAVRGAGFATLRMPRERYDGFKLLELVHRWNTKEATP